MAEARNWLAERRKAIVGFATQLGAVVVLVQPDASKDVKVGLGLLTAAIALFLIHRVPNRRRHAPRR